MILKIIQNMKGLLKLSYRMHNQYIFNSILYLLYDFTRYSNKVLQFVWGKNSNKNCLSQFTTCCCIQVYNFLKRIFLYYRDSGILSRHLMRWIFRIVINTKVVIDAEALKIMYRIDDSVSRNS